MKKNINIIFLGLILTFPAVSSAETWSPFGWVKSNTFSVNKTTVSLNVDYHSCGNNNVGKLDYSVVGADFAKTFNDVLMTASAAGLRVSVQVDGCVAGGNRANIIGIKIK